jgi:hypothetical protein
VTRPTYKEAKTRVGPLNEFLESSAALLQETTVMYVEHPIDRKKLTFRRMQGPRPDNLHVGQLRSLARLGRTGATTPTGPAED